MAEHPSFEDHPVPFPDALTGHAHEADEAWADRWLDRIDELLDEAPGAVLRHYDEIGEGAIQFAPVSCPLCRRIDEIEHQAADETAPAGARA